LRISKPGITLQSAPGERATIKARVYVPAGADGVTVQNLNLNGAPNPVPSPTINADNTRWLNNDVTNEHRSKSCFIIGHIDYGTATGTLIRNNRIHDCGSLPGVSTYPHGHGIYINSARDTRIIGNEIYGNTDRGIQLRIDAQRTTIERNIIDGNGTGIIFSGDHGSASNGTVVTNNIISFPRDTYTVNSFYPTGNPIGQNNVVRNNCMFDGRGSGVKESQVGFSASDNVIRDPLYVDRAKHDFRLREGSPCKSILAG
jgi:parallel beta-helix repeat protein